MGQATKRIGLDRSTLYHKNESPSAIFKFKPNAVLHKQLFSFSCYLFSAKSASEEGKRLPQTQIAGKRKYYAIAFYFALYLTLSMSMFQFPFYHLNNLHDENFTALHYGCM